MSAENAKVPFDIGQRRDVEERIGLHHDDIGQFAGLDAAEVSSNAQNPGSRG